MKSEDQIDPTTVYGRALLEYERDEDRPTIGVGSRVRITAGASENRGIVQRQGTVTRIGDGTITAELDEPWSFHDTLLTLPSNCWYLV